MKKILSALSFLLFLFSSHAHIKIPDYKRLKPIYRITDASNVELEWFPEYEDIGAYGTLPNCLELAHLSSINSLINWGDKKEYEIKSAHKLYVAKMKSAFIAPSHIGTVFDSTQQLLFDITVVPGTPLFWTINFDVSQKKISRHKKIATVQGHTLFYHSVIDRLPSVLLMKELLLHDPEIKLIINSPLRQNYIFEYLELIGIPREQMLVPDVTMVYYADEVYFATPFMMEPIPKKLLTQLRETLLESARKKATVQYQENNLIIIIQRKENDRRIKNIDELSRLLKSFYPDTKYQHVVFDASGSVADQILLFNRAHVIIGAMASGLTNIIYANPGAHIIEVHPTQYASSQGAEWVWWLSSAMKLDYWVVPTPYRLTDPLITFPLEPIREVLQKIKEQDGKLT